MNFNFNSDTHCMLSWLHATEGIIMQTGTLKKLYRMYLAIKDVGENSKFDLRITETDEKIDLDVVNRAITQKRRSQMDLYVIVIHTPTGRAFTLDRGYNLITPLVEKAYPAMFGPIETGERWQGWIPLQRPEWANELIEQGRQDEFSAWWLKEATQPQQQRQET